MRPPLTAVIGSLLWLVIAPGSVTVLVPWLLSQWEVQLPFFGLNAFRWVGWLLILIGVSGLIEAFAQFAFYGRGTPAPYMLTDRLVITGSYCHVRNPMYIAILSVVMGQSLILGQNVLLGYVLVLWVAFQAFVLFYEEPSLKRRYGQQYDNYRTAVRRWWPRAGPWSADASP